MPRYYEVGEPNFPWGDYGAMLFSGLNANDPPEPKFPVKLQRTGPYVPDFTRPWGYVVVTGKLRSLLEQTDFRGFTFAKVELDRIVDINWHEWDLTAEDPLKYPSGGEPENYVLRRKHNPKIAAQLPELWALDIAELTLPWQNTTFEEQRLDPSVDIFEAAWSVYVTPRFKKWMVKHIPDCVSFKKPKNLFESK